jgi:Meiotically up-regulated gene 113
MELLQVNGQLTMSSLELVDFIFSETMREEIKDYDWYQSSLLKLSKIEALSSMPFIKMHLECILHSAMRQFIVRKEENKKNCILYVMQTKRGRLLKIGRTNESSQKRLKQLKVGCPDIELLYEFNGKGGFEAAAHRALKQYSVGGEWFNCTADFAVKTINKVITE